MGGLADKTGGGVLVLEMEGPVVTVKVNVEDLVNEGNTVDAETE